MIVGHNGKQIKPVPFETYRTCDECVDEIKMIRRALFAEGGTADEGEPANITNNSSGGNGNRATNTSHNSGDQELSSNHDNGSATSITKYMNTRISTHMVESSTQSSVNGTPLLQGATNNTPEDDDNSDHNLCPVCAVNLLKLFQGSGNDEFEAFKEAHICDCLTAFDFNLDHQRSPTANGSRMHTRNKMLVYNIPPIPKPQFESIPNNIDNPESSGSQPSLGLGGFLVGSDNSTSTVNMSEKYVDRECVICLEDLKPGDKVGRLECLCVFHYKCIKDWFNKKGYGECPVHFLHK